MTQQFDWAEARKRNRVNAAWLEKNWSKPLTEKEFINAWLALPGHEKRTSTKQPSKKYHYLKQTFGFFQS